MFSFFRREKEIIKIHFLIVSMILILCSIFALVIFNVSESDLENKTEAFYNWENIAKSYTCASITENLDANGNK